MKSAAREAAGNPRGARAEPSPAVVSSGAIVTAMSGCCAAVASVAVRASAGGPPRSAVPQAEQRTDVGGLDDPQCGQNIPAPCARQSPLPRQLLRSPLNHTWHESTCSQPVECRDARLIRPSESPQELLRNGKATISTSSRRRTATPHDGASYTSSAPLGLLTGGLPSGRPTHLDRHGPDDRLARFSIRV